MLNINTGQRVGSLVANGGNPNLMPYTSDNVDLSVEWYYQPNSYLSVDAFNKNVTDFVVAGSTQQTINGVIDPTTGAPAIFTVSTNVNGPTANVYGAEFAVQHVFGDSGFGFQANATLVGTNKPYDPLNLSISGFAVTGSGQFRQPGAVLRQGRLPGAHRRQLARCLSGSFRPAAEQFHVRLRTDLREWQHPDRLHHQL